MFQIQSCELFAFTARTIAGIQHSDVVVGLTRSKVISGADQLSRRRHRRFVKQGYENRCEHELGCCGKLGRRYKVKCLANIVD